MSKAKTIVLGASHWHMPLCAPQIAESHDVVAFSDEVPARVVGLVDLWQAPVSSSWREVLWEHPDAELAYVFVPHDEMREACLALVERRIPFVVEKPLGHSLEDLVDVRTAAEAAGVPIAIPLVQWGGPVDTWLAQAGRATYETTQFIAGPPDRYLHNGSPWMVDLARAGGGCMANLAPHFVEFFLRSAGAESARVTCSISSALHGREIEDYATLTITTDDGRIGTVEVGYAFPDSPLKRHCSYLRVGDRGVASISSDGRATFTGSDGVPRTDVLDVDSDPLYPVFIRGVARELENGFAGLPRITDLEPAMAVVWEAYRQGREGTGHVSSQH